MDPEILLSRFYRSPQGRMDLRCGCSTITTTRLDTPHRRMLVKSNDGCLLSLGAMAPTVDCHGIETGVSSCCHPRCGDSFTVLVRAAVDIVVLKEVQLHGGAMGFKPYTQALNHNTKADCGSLAVTAVASSQAACLPRDHVP